MSPRITRAGWTEIRLIAEMMATIRAIVRTLVESCQLAMENGARRALIPIENRRQGDVA